MTKLCLKGEITEEQVLGWSEEEWRAFQFKCMIETNIRLSKLESQAALRNILISVPWALLGGIIVYLIQGGV